MGYGNNKIAVIGLGYVGLPLAAEFAKNGHETVGIDIDESKIENINNGVSYIEDIPSESLKTIVDSGKLSATTDFSAVKETDTILISVPTPVTVHKTPEIKFIKSVVDGIAPFIRKGHMVILRSTTYPGTTREFIVPIMEDAGLKIGEECHVAFAPERVDPGNTEFSFANTPVVVGGITAACTDAAAKLMESVSKEAVKVSNPEAAEMSKLLENIFRSVNIALINEMAMLCDRIGGIDIWEVVEAAATKPFGFKKFTPGPGIGGHCIQIDPYYLSWKAKQYNFYSDFIEQAAKTNENMPYYVADRVIKALAMTTTPLPESKVLILGLAYKPDINDLRNSPGVHVWEALLQRGLKNIEYSDPYVEKFENANINQKSIKLTPESIKGYDCVIIITDHTIYDWKMIFENAGSIIDTRNASSNVDIVPPYYYLLGHGGLGKNNL